MISWFAVMVFLIACGNSSNTCKTSPIAEIETESTEVIPRSSVLTIYSDVTKSTTVMPGSPVVVTDGGTYWTITARQLALFTIKDYLVALVEDDTVYIGELSGTDIFVNIAIISDQLDKFPPDKNKPILLTCSSGAISPIVASFLVMNGYSHIMVLEGGVLGWYYLGYPIYDRQEGEPVFF
jgi:rhodanese-related sulfurtransferase